MDAGDAGAGEVARAIAAALDWQSPLETRTAAVAFLESVKSGDIRVLANTSFNLVRKNWSSEIRLHGFKLLQHLVRLRWDELTSAERKNFASLAMGLISEFASPKEDWALKSQTAALVAEVGRREGVEFLQELLPYLTTLSHNGPSEAELAVMVLRWLPEDITVHNEDLDADRRRLLLRGITQSLSGIFPLLYHLLERHFGAAMNDAGRQQFDSAKQHAATVSACLNALNSYAEWAPLSDLAKFGLIHGCGFLLSSVEFRLRACEFFKLVSARKRPVDASGPDFDGAVINIFQILLSASKDFLLRCSSLSPSSINENEFEFAECLCESLVLLGSTNLQSVSGDTAILPLFLQQMLAYFLHFKFPLHFQSLFFWLMITRESLTKSKVSTQVLDSIAVSDSGQGGQVEKEKKKVLVFIDNEVCGAILDVSLQRLLKKSAPHPGQSIVELELWNEDYVGKSDFSQYRSRLLELIRLVTIHKPIIAAARIAQRINSVMMNSMGSMVSPQSIPLMESMQLALETIVSAIFDGSVELGVANSETKFSLVAIFEELLNHLLLIKWSEPALAEILTHYLDALGPFLKHYPDGVAGVITKLFDLLAALPFDHKDPSSLQARGARLQICTSFIRIAKSAEMSLLPHMKVVADTVAFLQREGRLLRAEHNLLGEALLVMASTAGVSQQEEILAWLLEPLSKQWIQLDWQIACLSDPMGLVKLCSDKAFMWSIFHTVTFFEKALKRSGTKRGAVSSGSSYFTDGGINSHPLAPHISWMLPPLLRLIRSIHSLWSEPVKQALPSAIQGAMAMSQLEQASLLGDGKLSKGCSGYSDGLQHCTNQAMVPELDENDIRNWLKGIRDSGYSVLGLSCTIGNCFFGSVENSSVLALALMENIQSMEFRHIRLLIRLVVIPVVKYCPNGLWKDWLGILLQPLFFHCQQALNCSWMSLLQGGRAKLPDAFAAVIGSDLKIEVMEEKILRDLTREICNLLSVISSQKLNSTLPSLDHISHQNRSEMSTLKNIDSLARDSMMCFFLTLKAQAVPALQITVEAFSWTDSEAITKITPFVGSLILLAVTTSNIELRQFVAKDLFIAIIQGLTLESNEIISAELVGYCREIFVHLSDSPFPKQILLSLPPITAADVQAFEEAVAKTGSSKEQKQHMKSLLSLAAGTRLRALSSQKGTNVITNVTVRTRTRMESLQPTVEGDGVIGLAAIT